MITSSFGKLGRVTARGFSEMRWLAKVFHRLYPQGRRAMCKKRNKSGFPQKGCFYPQAISTDCGHFNAFTFSKMPAFSTFPQGTVITTGIFLVFISRNNPYRKEGPK
jgi:hypothetical protein